MALCILLYCRMPRADRLPNDVESLKALLRAAHGTVDTLTAKLRSRDVLIEQLKLQLARLKRMKFGRSSEALDAQIGQLELSLEELEANEAASTPAEAPTSAPAAKPVRKPSTRASAPASGACTSLPAVTAAARSAAEHFVCWARDVLEVLEYVPEHWKVHRHVRPKYSCGTCQAVVQASAPSRPIERGYAGPGLLPMCCCPSTAITSPCIGKARSMPGRALSWIGLPSPSGSERSAPWWTP